MATEKDRVDAKTAFGCLGIAVFLFFLVASLVTPHIGADPQDMLAAEKYRTEIRSRFAVTFASSNVKVEQLGGFNLEVWIPRREFEHVNYPERKSFLEKAGGDWCEDVETWTAPTVTVRDAGNGKNLAVYHCRFGYVDMKPN